MSTMHPCARCAAVQRTCCQQAEILVTAGDIERITKQTGKQTFHERRAPSEPSYLDNDADDPNWLAYTVYPSGKRRVLIQQPNGDCGFLGQTGCELSLAVRPLVCRLYPYSYNEQGLTGIDSEYCPTAMLAKSGESMADVLDIPASAAEAWRKQLYEELAHGTA